MSDPRFNMIISYFDIKSLPKDAKTTIYEYKSKSTKVKYYFKVDKELVHEFRKTAIVNDDFDKLMRSLVGIMRDERVSNINKYKNGNRNI